MKGNFSEFFRPKTLEDYVGQSHLLEKGKILRTLIESHSLRAAIFWGPPGCGKTSLAKIIANLFSLQVKYINASIEGAGEIKELVRKFSKNNNLFEKEILLIVDELHRFNKPQQDTLLEAVERGWIYLIGITTESPYSALSPPLLSRCYIFKFKNLSSAELKELAQKVIDKKKMIVSSSGIDYIIKRSCGDGRKLLQLLEVLYLSDKEKNWDLEEVKKVLGEIEEEFVYDKREHYEVISAFIKSMRGSDPDAALYWLARMIKYGEKPEFIARRILIQAAEDVGLANPMALVVATSAVDAVSRVGWPEARIILAEAVLYITLSPKSNSAIKGIDNALKALEEGEIFSVPDHLKNHHPAARFYKNPHHYPHGWVEQKYLPKELELYQAVKNGVEERLFENWKKIKKMTE